MARGRLQLGNLGITRGALVVGLLEIVCSIVFLAMDYGTRDQVAQYIVATPANVFEHGRVWTLVTSSVLKPSFVTLLLHAFVLWQFAPTLERFWGTPRFYRFAIITSIAGNSAGVLLGFALGREVPIAGLDPFVWALIVAFGIIYAKQPVQFFAVLPMTARQMMYGFLGLAAAMVLFGQNWEQGASYAGAIFAAVVLTSKKWNPGLAWKRWRIARARAKLAVLEGGRGIAKKRDEQKWVN
ncbi:MAG: rhomboid family intramembrane serine protease [Kofleriaceae bacterium]|nr:rhomboid family intramembrane serine protease [Kofleriaceae bacterium]